MAYTPINWQTGDTITAEKLNRCDNGWSVTSGTTTLINETVTTAWDEDGYWGDLSGSVVSYPTVIVTYDGTPYSCDLVDDARYGGTFEDFSEYPFGIGVEGWIVTETGGAHTIKIEAVTSITDTSASFDEAVAAASPVMLITIGTTTWQQVYDAIVANKVVFYNYDDGTVASSYIANTAAFDDTDNRYRVFLNGGSMTFSASSSNGALIAD